MPFQITGESDAFGPPNPRKRPRGSVPLFFCTGNKKKKEDGDWCVAALLAILLSPVPNNLLGLSPKTSKSAAK
jgi:hypothetical protein